jgi:DNA-binding CsgD family transcriptional regulator
MPAARSPVLVGRQAELATALQLLHAAGRGEGSTLLVTGEAGIGKSRLLAELARRAPEASMTVLRGRAMEGASTFRPMTEALARLLRGASVPHLLDSSRLRPYRAALQRLVPGWEPGPATALDGDLDPSVVLGEGVLALLAEARGGRGHVLVLEDLHWADRDTLDLVSYLVDAVSGEPVLLALTARDDAASPGTVGLTDRPGVTTLRLHRLSADEVATLAAACRGGTPLPESELRELVRRSDGLPFLVEELLDDEMPASGVPRTLVELVTHRLAALPSREQQVLVTAAIVSGDPDRLLLAEVTAEPETVVRAALRAGVHVGLLVSDGERLQWRHALTRAALLATLLPPDRAELTARVARALDARGDPEARAAAAGLFAAAGDGRRAAELYVDLARREVVRGTLHSAEDHLSRAAATGRLGGKVAIERVRVLTLLGRAVEAIDVGEAALAAAAVRGGDHAELCLRLARAAVVGGRWGDAESFLELTGRPDDPRSAVLAADAAFGAGDVGRAVAIAETAVRAADHVDTRLADSGEDPTERYAVQCEALCVLARCLIGTDPDAAEATLRRAVQVSAEHGLTPWRVQALFVLGSLEHTRGHPAAPSLAAARDLAIDAGVLAQAVQADLLLSDAALLVDGPRAALPLVQRAARGAERLRLSGQQAAVETIGAAIAALAGELSTATRLLEAASGRADPPMEVITLAPMVRGLPHLMRHDLPRAAALVDEGITALLAHRSAAPTPWFGLWVLLRTAVADRDREARDALRSHHSLISAANAAALGYAEAIAAGRSGRRDAAVAHFAESDASIAHLTWWNRLLRLLALEAAVTDGWGDPVPALRADLAAHEQTGDDQLARTCRDLLRAAGAPSRRRRHAPLPPGLAAAGVTAREAEVLALITTGLTNAETARRLFLSTRTVDTHVARLLAKSGAANRAELARWARTIGSAAGVDA